MPALPPHSSQAPAPAASPAGDSARQKAPSPARPPARRRAPAAGGDARAAGAGGPLGRAPAAGRSPKRGPLLTQPAPARPFAAMPPAAAARPPVPRGIWRTACQNLATATAVGTVFASHNASHFHALGIGKTGLLALYGTFGGWPAVACHVVGVISAVFGAAWGVSRATPDDATGVADWYARRWPAVVLGASLGIGGPLGLLASAPAAAALLASCAYVCLSAAQRSHGQQGPLTGDLGSQAAVVSFAVGLSFAIGAGAPAGLALLHASTLLAASSLAALAYHLGVLAIHREFPTPFTDAVAIRPRVVEHTRLEPALAAPAEGGALAVQTVFQTPPGFAELVGELQRALDQEAPHFNGFLGQPVATVFGAPGGGKSTSAVALAQALSRPGHAGLARAVHKDDLEQNQLGQLPIVALNLACAVLESDFLGRRDGTPVVLTIEEIESIFPQLDLPKAKAGEFDANFIKSLGFLFFLQVMHLLSQTRSGVVLVATTNFAPEVRPLLDLLSTRAPIAFQAPTADTQRAIVTSQLATLGATLARDHGLPVLPLTDDAERLEAFLAAAAGREGGLSGRDLTTCLRFGSRAAQAEAARQRDRGQAVDAFALVRCVFERMQLALLHLPEEPRPPSRAAGTRARPHAAPAAPLRRRPSASQQLEDTESVLRRLHVSDLEAAEVFERLTQAVVNVSKAYADPTNTASIAQLKLRLARTAYLFSQLQKRTVLETLPRRDFHDVLDASPLKTFFGGDDPEAWMNFGRSLKTWATLNSATLIRLGQQAYGSLGIDAEAALGRLRLLQQSVQWLPEQARTSFAGASSQLREFWR